MSLQRPVTTRTRKSVAGTPWAGLVSWIDYTANADTVEGIDLVRGVTSIAGDVTSGYATQKRFHEIGHGWVPAAGMWHRFDHPLPGRPLSENTTMVAIVTMPEGSVSGTTYTAMQGNLGSSSTNATIAVRASDFEVYYRFGGGTPGATNFPYVTVAHTAAMRDGKAHVLVATLRAVVGGNATVDFYFDGQLLGSNTVPLTVAAAAMTVWSPGRFDRPGAVNSNGNVTLHAVGLFNRALSAGEVAQISADPWNPWTEETILHRPRAATLQEPPPTVGTDQTVEGPTFATAPSADSTIVHVVVHRASGGGATVTADQAGGAEILDQSVGGEVVHNNVFVHKGDGSRTQWTFSLSAAVNAWLCFAFEVKSLDDATLASILAATAGTGFDKTDATEAVTTGTLSQANVWTLAIGSEREQSVTGSWATALHEQQATNTGGPTARLSATVGHFVRNTDTTAITDTYTKGASAATPTLVALLAFKVAEPVSDENNTDVQLSPPAATSQTAAAVLADAQAALSAPAATGATQAAVSTTVEAQLTTEAAQGQSVTGLSTSVDVALQPPAATGATTATVAVDAAGQLTAPQAVGQTATSSPVDATTDLSAPTATGQATATVHVEAAAQLQSEPAQGQAVTGTSSTVTTSLTAPSATGASQASVDVAVEASLSAEPATGSAEVANPVTADAQLTTEPAQGQTELEQPLAGRTVDTALTPPAAGGQAQATVVVAAAATLTAPAAGGSANLTVTVTTATTLETEPAQGHTQVAAPAPGVHANLVATAANGQAAVAVAVAAAAALSPPAAEGTAAVASTHDLVVELAPVAANGQAQVAVTAAVEVSLLAPAATSESTLPSRLSDRLEAGDVSAGGMEAVGSVGGRLEAAAVLSSRLEV